MQETALDFQNFPGGGGGGGGDAPQTPLANSLALLSQSLAALGRAPRIITLQFIFETWQARNHLYEAILSSTHNIPLSM